MPSGDQAVVQEERAVALPWYKEISRYQWKVFVAAGLGYGLEAMDMMLYAMVILEVMKELQMNPATGGLVASLSLFFCSVRWHRFWRLR